MEGSAQAMCAVYEKQLRAISSLMVTTFFYEHDLCSIPYHAQHINVDPMLVTDAGNKESAPPPPNKQALSQWSRAGKPSLWNSVQAQETY